MRIAGRKYGMRAMTGDTRGYPRNSAGLRDAMEAFLILFDDGIGEGGGPQDRRVLMARSAGENHSEGRGGCSRVTHPPDPVCTVTGYAGRRNAVTSCDSTAMGSRGVHRLFPWVAATTRINNARATDRGVGADLHRP